MSINSPAHPVASTSLHTLHPQQVVAPPAPVQPTTVPAPNYQQLDSNDSPEEDDDEPDWDAIGAEVDASFSEAKIDEMIDTLKERGIFRFLTRYITEERIPISKLLLIFGARVPPEASFEQQLRLLKMYCSRVLQRRDKLEAYNTVDDAVELIRNSKKILVLTGAGVSTSCGIPDFRSPTGLYAQLRVEHPELDDPQEMFDLAYFKEKPNVFYSFAKEIYPSNFIPSPCHRFVRLLELNNKLLRNYTQNIDGLFEQVGVQRMLNCHGSFATASCLRCRTQFPGSAIEADVFASRVALCPLCTAKDEAEAAAAPPKKEKKPPAKWKEGGESDSEDEDGWVSEWAGKPLVKPDIVFFGEMLSDEFDHRLAEDREEVDLLIVVGTSLRVAPVASIVSHLPHSVPQIVINRDPIQHANFDIHLLGDGDTIVQHLCERLAAAAVNDPTPPASTDTAARSPWDLGRVPVQAKAANGTDTKPPVTTITPERVGDSHVWLFPGADPEHRWVQAVRRAFSGEDSEEDEESEEDSEGPTMQSALELAETGGDGSGGSEESDEAEGGAVDDEEAEGRRGAGRARSEEGEDGEAKKARLE